MDRKNASEAQRRIRKDLANGSLSSPFTAHKMEITNGWCSRAWHNRSRLLSGEVNHT